MKMITALTSFAQYSLRREREIKSRPTAIATVDELGPCARSRAERDLDLLHRT